MALGEVSIVSWIVTYPATALEIFSISNNGFLIDYYLLSIRNVQ